MKLMDPENPILTKNDQEVLKSILDQAKLPDAEIARKMRLSQQAVYKIRTKLEEKGIIEGYMPIINFKKIGINLLCVLAVRVLPAVWKELSEELVAQRIRELPHVITAFRVPESDISHLLMFGFKDIDQKDRVIMKLETKFSDEIEIKQVYPFSVNRVISMSPIGLLREVLDKKDSAYDHLFLEKKNKI
jgi:DNA-binding Lrp family transcriptional regulator